MGEHGHGFQKRQSPGWQDSKGMYTKLDMSAEELRTEEAKGRLEQVAVEVPAKR